MRVSKRTEWPCDECGGDEGREMRGHNGKWLLSLCDHCAESLASVLLQRVRETRQRQAVSHQGGTDR